MCTPDGTSPTDTRTLFIVGRGFLVVDIVMRGCSAVIVVLPLKESGLGFLCYTTFQRASAACLAISERRSGVNVLARAFPPFNPPFRVADGSGSSISPVAIFITWTAHPTTSAGRLSPLGPRGMPIPPFEDKIIYQGSTYVKHILRGMSSFFQTDALPKTPVLVGGGPIGRRWEDSRWGVKLRQMSAPPGLSGRFEPSQVGLHVPNCELFAGRSGYSASLHLRLHPTRYLQKVCKQSGGVPSL